MKKNTEDKEIQASVGKILIDQHLFFFLNAASNKLNEIPVL